VAGDFYDIFELVNSKSINSKKSGW